MARRKTRPPLQKRSRVRRVAALAATLTMVATGTAPALAPPKGPPVAIAYVEKQVERLPPLNNEDPVPANLGLAGAELGRSDSNMTGRFVGLAFALDTTVVASDGDLAAAVKDVMARTHPSFLVVNASAPDLLKLADLPESRDVLLFNIAAPDDRLRDADCRGNVLHTAASRAMLTDALAQFLLFKRWTRILLLSGPHPEDKLFAQAVRRSAKKFGAQVVAEPTYDAHGADIRDSALREFALATRASAYDVVVVADEANEFGASVNYNTDLPRPVMGTQGLTPAAWGRPVEAWAAVQLQRRFAKATGRTMTPTDYAGWMAVHAIGEAAVQLKSADPVAIRKLMLSPGFEVGGFKGRALSFRPWDGQLREPIFDLWTGAVVATAPLEGFIHQRSDLDTLGTDQPESRCRMSRP